ncbi:MAG: hypothetical protein MUF03_10055 [Rubrivivax sp.]|jgi:hypothetical protein|nr:hypothetical protein [Rubrivivax sp.]
MGLPRSLGIGLLALALAGCATRAVDVRPAPASPAEFATWDCTRLDDEADRVQQRAADVAYSVDERVGNNIVALGVGLTIFWPALLAMRPAGPEAEELARLKGRFEMLRVVAQVKQCPPPSIELPPARAAALPVAVGERLVYEQRTALRGPMEEWALRLVSLRRDEYEFRIESGDGPTGVWRQDPSGNVIAAPDGTLHWPRLLRGELVPGHVLAGEITLAGDPLARARVRGQVLAVGPQVVAGRRFDAAVIEFYGDALRGDIGSRLEGGMVVDRTSGVLLRLDLTTAQPGFTLQRRLVRIEAAPN